MKRLFFGVRSGMTSLLVVGALTWIAPFAGAQGGGGGGGGSSSGFGGTSLSAKSGSIGSTTSSGSGNLSTLRSSSSGLSSLSTSTTTSKTTSTIVPSSSNPFAGFYQEPVLTTGTTTSASGSFVPQFPITTSTTTTVKAPIGQVHEHRFHDLQLSQESRLLHETWR